MPFFRWDEDTPALGHPKRHAFGAAISVRCHNFRGALHVWTRHMVIYFKLLWFLINRVQDLLQFEPLL